MIALAAVLAIQGLYGAAAAQEAPSGGAVVGDVLEALHLRQTPPRPPDFVVRSRPEPDSLRYQPMKPTENPTDKKTPAQLDALGAELEGALEQNRKAGRRVAVPDSSARPTARGRSAAAKPQKDQAN